MSPTTSSRSGSETRLARILDDHLAAVQRGEARDREVLLAAHPDLAEDLAACLSSLDFLRVISPVGGLGGGPIGDGAAPGHLGDFRILRELGRGGMGVVYEAHQVRLDRRVALKVVLAGRFAPAEDFRRFGLEAEAAAQLDHPNIIPIFEVGEQAGLPYLSMKLLEGGSLADQLETYRDDPRAAADLAVTIARAVHHAHERGILHRDLKPSNILMDSAGRPYVTDFGLAKRLEAADEVTRTGVLLGSPPYMAPEQAAGDRRSVTISTDVYGLGAVLYALLTGRPPFRGESAAETMERVRTGTPDPPSGLNRAIDPDLEAICLKALARRPDRRYRTAADLADDLDRWLSGRPTVARPLSRSARLRRWAWRRRRGLVAAVTALAMLGLVGLGVWQTARLRHAWDVAQRQEEAIRVREGEIRRRQYIADVRRAASLIALNRAPWAKVLLEGYLPTPGRDDVRGFEWSYLHKNVDVHRASWVGHEGREVYHVEFAPDGRTLATAGGDRTARVWDAATGDLLKVLRGHGDEVNWVSFDPAGRRLVTAGDDATVRVWDAADGRELVVFNGFDRPVVAALFTPDGRDVIGAARDGQHIRWDAATKARRAAGRPGIQASGDWVEALAISPLGTPLAVTGRIGSIVCWDLSRGGLDNGTVPPPTGTSHGGCLAFSPDGRTLAATGGGEDTEAVLYDMATGRPRVTLKWPSAVPFTLAFSPDGRTLAAGDGRNFALRLWDLESRQCRVVLQGHEERIWCVAFAPDGRTLATTSRDGTVRLWDARMRLDPLVFRGLPREPRWKLAASVAFAGDGRRLLVANAIGDVLECDLSSGGTRLARGADLPLRTVVPSLAPDGSAIVVNDYSDSTTEAASGVVLHDLAGRRPPIKLPVGPDDGYPRVWSPDGKRLAVVERTGWLSLWDPTNGQTLGRADFGFSAGSSWPSFLPAGDALFAFCGNGVHPNRWVEYVRWEPSRSRLERRPLPKGAVMGFNAGKVLLAPAGRTGASLLHPWLWDYPSLHARAQLIGHGNSPTDLAFSPDGRTLATTSLDHTVRLWDVATGLELLTLEGHTGPVRLAAFAPDGRALATCGDGPESGIEVIVWRAEARSGGKPPEPRPRSP